MYLASCKLHFQTVTFLNVLTLKQYVNAKTLWGSEVRNINRHDDYCQPLITYAASILGHSWSFFGEAGGLWTKSFFYPWSALNPGLQSAVWNLQSALTLTDIKSKKLTIQKLELTI